MPRAPARVLALALVVLACGGRSRRFVGEGSAAQGGSGGVSYSTNFDDSEAPLSERSAWHHTSTAGWTNVETRDGIAFGTQPLGSRGDDTTSDSYAYLSGFPPDQEAEGIVHLAQPVESSCTHEVELLLRFADSASAARGYECSLAFDGSYVHIVRWNGALGDFEFLATSSVPGGLHDGDAFSASIVGDRIALAVNGVELASASDDVFTTGNPGIGFWRGLTGCGALGDFGFTSFSASSLDE